MIRTVRCFLLLLTAVGFLFGSAAAQEVPASTEAKQISSGFPVFTGQGQSESFRSQSPAVQRREMRLSTAGRGAQESDGYNRWARRMAVVQGTYYLATGLWPIFHMQSFEKVAGSKRDDWLVKTVGALLSVVGGTLLVSGVRDAPSRDLAAVAVGSAAVLTAVDVIYVARDRIPPVYLLDAAGETVLMAGWTITLTK